MVGGEALSVADTKEAWIFHVCPDDTGASAIWAAQRVPDGHIAVVANDFVIKEVFIHSYVFRY
jgi:dipeptidase